MEWWANIIAGIFIGILIGVKYHEQLAPFIARISKKKQPKGRKR